MAKKNMNWKALGVALLIAAALFFGIKGCNQESDIVEPQRQVLLAAGFPVEMELNVTWSPRPCDAPNRPPSCNRRITGSAEARVVQATVLAGRCVLTVERVLAEADYTLRKVKVAPGEEIEVLKADPPFTKLNPSFEDIKAYVQGEQFAKCNS